MNKREEKKANPFNPPSDSEAVATATAATATAATTGVCSCNAAAATTTLTFIGPAEHSEKEPLYSMYVLHPSPPQDQNGREAGSLRPGEDRRGGTAAKKRQN